jgi:hypothetical protein
MTTPQRVQITRRRPWRPQHPDAVIVDRRTKWGNPYTLEEYRVDYPDSMDDLAELRRMAVSDFRGMLDGKWGEEYDYPDVTELRGRDLACWCPPDQPCHADVLLEYANRRAS